MSCNDYIQSIDTDQFFSLVPLFIFPCGENQGNIAWVMVLGVSFIFAAALGCFTAMDNSRSGNQKH